MARNPRGGEEEWPHFYKVIFSPVSQGIRIPTTFMQTHGHFLSNNTVVIKVPTTGASWSVELRQDECGTWLGGSGWKEFAAYYGIEACHFLMFKYPGNAHFHVTIFDPDGSEIEYPMEEEEEENLKKPGGGGKEMVEPGNKLENSSYRKAQAFRSENPFFVRLMKPSAVGKRYSLTFNSMFPGSEIPVKERSCLLKFHVPGNAKVWILRCSIYKAGRQATVSGGGWKEFALDNNLCVNDACVFELLKGSLDFNITIFRNT